MRVIFHIPHDGDFFPDELMKSLVISKDRFTKYHYKMSDKFVTKLVSGIEKTQIITFPVSRLLCDVEKYLENEEMDQFGMGYYYTKAYDGKVIKIRNEQLEEITKRYYTDHHESFRRLIESVNEDVVIIDIHSFSEDIIVNTKYDPNVKLPDVDLGWEERTCPKWLKGLAEETFIAKGYKISHNYPYSGSFIPDLGQEWLKKNKCYSIMLEINKDAYMNKDKYDLEKGKKIKACITEIVEKITRMV